jgi:hypothetical protein
LQINTKNIYLVAYNILDKSLAINGSFKECVFSVEDCFKENIFDYDAFNSIIKAYSLVTKKYMNLVQLKKYRFPATSNFLKNSSIYGIIKDKTILNIDSVKTILLPFTYNFSDPFGIDDWTNTFVTKLLAKHKGNCRSLTYLYKILADELGAKCWLALAPNHIYIRNYSQKIGWYNTELTSGTFPTDAWIMTTSYTNPEAVMSGLYMDTLSNQQSIAMCVYDLARGYEYQTQNYYDGFILKCCDLVLKYHPVNPNALLLKAETLKKLYLQEKETKYPRIKATKSEMEATYIKLAKLGYREMPDNMYKKWLKKLQEEKEQNGLKNPKPKKE